MDSAPAYNQPNRCLPGEPAKKPARMFSLSILGAWFLLHVSFPVAGFPLWWTCAVRMIELSFPILSDGSRLLRTAVVPAYVVSV